jgi:hypothetical protein
LHRRKPRLRVAGDIGLAQLPCRVLVVVLDVGIGPKLGVEIDHRLRRENAVARGAVGCHGALDQWRGGIEHVVAEQHRAFLVPLAIGDVEPQRARQGETPGRHLVDPVPLDGDRFRALPRRAGITLGEEHIDAGQLPAREVAIERLLGRARLTAVGAADRAGQAPFG